jgi:transcriptional regulator with XRE-family HTH domain
MDVAKRRRLVKKVGRIVDRLPMSRRQVARAAGISHTTVGRIVRGDPVVTYRTLEAIADSLTRLTKDLAGFEADIRDVLSQWEAEN